MKFDQRADSNPIDRLKVVGRAQDRIDGPLKVTGRAKYAYERHEAVPGQLYGYILGSGIACGRITDMALDDARRASGVVDVISTLDYEPVPLSDYNTANLFGGDEIQHYHQAIALVVAETFEQARAAAHLIRVDYNRTEGQFDLAAAAPSAPLYTNGEDDTGENRYGDFEGAYAASPVQLDAHYSTPDETHAMMEPHTTLAHWEGDTVTLWTSNQMIAWSKAALAKSLQMPAENIRLDSPFLGGGFGAKLFVRADAIVAALAAKKVGRPVKVTFQRPLVANNTTHRPATIQHIRLGADRDGRLLAIGHESISGDLPGGSPETAVNQTESFYAAENRLTAMRLAVLNLPEGNAMRAPGEAPGLMALEVAMDEMAEKLGMDPVDFRILNDTQVDPMKPDREYSERHMIECLRRGAREFGWDKRHTEPASQVEGDWLVGMGMAGGFRNNMLMKSGARVRLGPDGVVTVETDMTDIGTGSYTIIAQTAAEMMGLPLDRVKVELGDSDYPASAGSGGQWGAANSTAGTYAACVKLREQVAQKFGLDPAEADFTDGQVRQGKQSFALQGAAEDGELVAEDAIEYGDFGDKYLQSTFAGHFVQVSVNRFTGVTRIDRMLAVCDAGRILNPKSARSQVIGAMTMGAGAALTEELAVDTRFGLFINHDLASYEVPVHADIPHQEVIFLDEVDSASTPMKAKGVGELGLCGVGAAIANAIYNATGIRVRDYPLTLDKYLDRLPEVA
ncbi:xanthine dehydrogenase family protein molybdopterin-binding subunit [Altericroceibacterium spongiae]|uniref:Xanthine dehydrogenase family protein molybdopterin-binding subunit n=1 Tax=Altericroceibacterium spongiae TaxID=2320269 RepID=A0A420EPI5_9SPHN|nr:aldehyde oxidoreductase molybdenum-binding subunit PaoC [Altericroceibacterium spongiae]RKF22588.1 xanthine dehydrogenase family protein molybdopterin-binding subunit [Altericroceibacterium spongiae]